MEPLYGGLDGGSGLSLTQITFITSEGSSKTIDARDGLTVMQAAVDAGIDGIVAECGGNLSCATCHAYIAPEWIDRIPAPSPEEAVMIDCALHVRSDSRLTCQIVINPSLAGLVVTVPPSQS